LILDIYDYMMTISMGRSKSINEIHGSHGPFVDMPVEKAAFP
jgi:hypothetical protein